MENIYETNALAVVAPFIVHDIERTALMGMDYWPFGSNKQKSTRFSAISKIRGLLSANRRWLIFSSMYDRKGKRRYAQRRPMMSGARALAKMDGFPPRAKVGGNNVSNTR